MSATDLQPTRVRSLWLIAYRGLTDALAKSVMFAITVAAARTLPRAEFGMLALATTIGWLASVVADFGIQMHVARDAAQHPERSAVTLRRWLPVRLWSGLACLALGLAALAPRASTGAGFTAGALLALAYGFSGVTECLFHLFRGLRRTDLESTLTLVQRGSLGVTALGVLWVRPTLALLALAFLVSAGLTLAIALRLTRQLLPSMSDEAADVGLGREFIESVAPIGAGLVLSALYFRIDVFLLDLWRGSDDVAAYNAVFRLIEAVRLVPAAVLAVMLPSLFRARDTRLMRRLSLWLALAAAFVAAALWPLAGVLVSLLYGPTYGDAIGTFRLLLLSLPLMALNYVLTSQLIGWHGHRSYAAICGAALLVNVLLNARLITTLGMAGAAWATLWTEVVLTAGCALSLNRAPTGHAFLASPLPEVR